MKVEFEVNNQITSNEVDWSFYGLAESAAGELWLFSGGFATCLADLDIDGEIEGVIKNYGPFTKFHGSVTLEND